MTPRSADLQVRESRRAPNINAAQTRMLKKQQHVLIC
jgi:hypothetical protein